MSEKNPADDHFKIADWTLQKFKLPQICMNNYEKLSQMVTLQKYPKVQFSTNFLWKIQIFAPWGAQPVDRW